MALSTLNPPASPCLSTVKLNFFAQPTTIYTFEALFEATDNDLRCVADEATRIEWEFEGAVCLTAHGRHPMNLLIRSHPSLQH